MPITIWAPDIPEVTFVADFWKAECLLMFFVSLEHWQWWKTKVQFFLNAYVTAFHLTRSLHHRGLPKTSDEIPCCRHLNASIQQSPVLLLLSLPAVINNVLHNLVQHLLNQGCPNPDVLDGLRCQDRCSACGWSLPFEGFLPVWLIFPAKGDKIKVVRICTAASSSETHPPASGNTVQLQEKGGCKAQGHCLGLHTLPWAEGNRNPLNAFSKNLPLKTEEDSTSPQWGKKPWHLQVLCQHLGSLSGSCSVTQS